MLTARLTIGCVEQLCSPRGRKNVYHNVFALHCVVTLPRPVPPLRCGASFKSLAPFTPLLAATWLSRCRCRDECNQIILLEHIHCKVLLSTIGGIFVRLINFCPPIKLHYIVVLRSKQCLSESDRTSCFQFQGPGPRPPGCHCRRQGFKEHLSRAVR